ncbi:MAG TPA: transposase [Polyangiaceae bacterium]|nr:transposase [Polyangiaceae bacterium]
MHAVFLDGVYVPGRDATPEFRALPRLSTTDVADALQVARARILRYLKKRGVITLDSDADSDVLCVSEELAERDPALAQLAAAAVSGLAPAGPELRRKPRELAFAGRPGVVIDAPLSVREAGFSLHAATRAGPADEQGREALLKYILRPPLANERLLPGPDGLVRIALKKPFSDGTVAVDLDPLSLLCRLVALVPAPRFHTVRYFGVLAPAAKWRPLIVPKPGPSQATDDAAAPCAPSPCSVAPSSVGGSRYRPWAELLRSTFAVDVETCRRCGGRLRLLAVITDLTEVARFLHHRREPTEPPARAPPRVPPYFKTLVVRRRQPTETSTQQQLFEEH